MEKKRYIVELGTGADLHGMNVTKAACRAVRDAIGRSCLCGLVEILHRENFEGVVIDVTVACPFPEQVNQEEVLAVLPVGKPNIKIIQGGLITDGLCVECFGSNCASIVVANAAVTVWIEPAEPGCSKAIQD
ncbi:Lin0512 family protein [Desulfobulbus rhabdoformis]|uniref:Lin0512 family protein n=1 Tax=Desulfobulbus rhabdoformis TaxID=34032 RepID=UPI001963513F|nr:Lin0512 family protein [Desulfobulbus rhabdoformis]MBM9613851.1 Lin0512 family protein [Desulfobulbus rhabdoformis]